MESITGEIERALDAGLYYLAVVVTLALPDVCAALESANGDTNSKRYKAWCDQWIIPSYPQLTSEDIWSLRCGVIHQGRFGHGKMQYARVLFTLPDVRGNVFHRNRINDALNLDALLFCGDMVKAVSQWYGAKQNDPNVVANLPRLFRLHPKGLAPYMVGMPLIS